jgi:dipeptidyl aminopeptidase/acylaminoacyl peptidase
VVSFQGTSDVRSIFDAYFVVVDEDPDSHWAYTPLRAIGNASTPTLILHGDRDERVPSTQAHEPHAGLSARDVETRLVLYPREGHGIVERRHQLDLLRRVVDWFESHVADAPTGPGSEAETAGISR